MAARCLRDIRGQRVSLLGEIIEARKSRLSATPAYAHRAPIIRKHEVISIHQRFSRLRGGEGSSAACKGDGPIYRRRGGSNAHLLSCIRSFETRRGEIINKSSACGI